MKSSTLINKAGSLPTLTNSTDKQKDSPTLTCLTLVTRLAWTLACSKLSRPTETSLVGVGAAKLVVLDAMVGALMK